MKVSGLDRTQTARRLPPSELTLAGLVKHLALVEDRHADLLRESVDGSTGE